MNPDQHQHALNHKEMLHWYEIKSILGQGGFGITYLARDTNLNHDVAIKEYLPLEYATRTASRTVEPISGDHAETFEWGKARFLDEARTLFQFKHPNIVRVLSFFEHNNTGYMVMEREEGYELSDLIKSGERFEESHLQAIVLPILDGLALVHSEGFIHRDIKPQNIMVRKDGSPVLIDFGSARQAMGEQTHTMTTMVTPGYAPLEQYHENIGKQGPWTDIYALGATLYAAITGEAPADALKRSMARAEQSSDAYLRLSDIKKDEYSATFLNAIDHALEYAAKKRPQNVVEWSKMLRGVSQVLPPDIDTQIYMGPAVSVEAKAGKPPTPARTAPRRRKSSGFLSVLLVLIVAGLVFAFLRQEKLTVQDVIEEFILPTPEETTQVVPDEPPVSVQPLDKDAHELNKQLKAEKARQEVEAREAAEKAREREEAARKAEEAALKAAERARQQEAAARAAEAAVLAAKEAERKEELARIAKQERQLLEEALAAEQKRRQAYEEQQRQLQEEAEIAAQIDLASGDWTMTPPPAIVGDPFRLTILGANSAAYNQGQGMIRFTSIEKDGDWQGYWVQTKSHARCLEMKDGSWYWGNSSLRFEQNYSRLIWARDFCGAGKTRLYSGVRP